MEEKITLLEAYKAMSTFLYKYYSEFGQYNVNNILSDIEILPNGRFSDEAAWFDWLEAVKKTLDEKDK